MSRLLTPIPTPSHSNRSLRSIRSYGANETWAAKEECHLQADSTMDEWATCLRSLQSASHEETMKTAKQFTQVDSYAKHTYQALEKTSNALDALLNQKVALLSTVSTLTEIQSNLGLEQLAKVHWVEDTSPPAS